VEKKRRVTQRAQGRGKERREEMKKKIWLT